MDVLARWQGPFILAVIFSLFLPHIPPLFLLLVGFCLSLGLIFCRKLLISGFLCGFSWFFLHAHWATHWQLPKHLIKQPIEVSGFVSQIPDVNDDTVKFVLSLQQIAGVKLSWWQKVNVKLNWRVSEQNLIEIKNGQQLKLTVKLKPPHGFANLGGFSYSKWLLLKNIRATGYVYNKLPVTLINDTISLRQGIFDRQLKQTQGLKFQGILLALTMGEKQFIDKEHWHSIRVTGIGHLLAISGLHIGMMFMFCRFLCLWLVNGLNLVSRNNYNSSAIAILGGILGAIVYSWLAGFALTTIRAMIMLSVAMAAIYYARGNNSRNVLLTALTVILVLNPLAVLSSGLWLSFIAVLSILSLFWFWPDSTESTSSWRVYVVAITKIQLVLFVCLLPLCALLFNGVSISGSWVNLIAVPWVSISTVPLALLATLLTHINVDAYWLWWLADKSLALLFAFLNQPFNLSGWANISHLPWFVWLSLLVVLIVWILPIAKIHKLASGSLLFVTLVFNLKQTGNNSWRVDVLDVGQGLAVAIEYRGSWLIYDLGPAYSSGFNTAEQVIEPYLAYHGVSEVDWLVLSHADSDHAGNYHYFLGRFKVNHIIAPSELALDAILCNGQQFNWQGLDIRLLWPNQNYLNNAKLSRNDSSCVMHISSDYGSLLLTGDIAKRSEKKLVAQHQLQDVLLTADIMLAPHHGSMSSSSTSFIHTVSPKYVAFSSGFLNRYRFPRPEIVSRYQQNGATHHTTSVSGQISYFLTPEGIRVEQIRHSKLNYWYLNL